MTRRILKSVVDGVMEAVRNGLVALEPWRRSIYGSRGARARALHSKYPGL